MSKYWMSFWNCLIGSERSETSTCHLLGNFGHVSWFGVAENIRGRNFFKCVCTLLTMPCSLRWWVEKWTNGWDWTFFCVDLRPLFNWFGFPKIENYMTEHSSDVRLIPTIGASADVRYWWHWIWLWKFRNPWCECFWVFFSVCGTLFGQLQDKR